MALSTPTAPTTYRRPLAAPAPLPSRPHGASVGFLTRLDAVLEDRLGADLRLIYGLAVPVLVLLALMIPMFAFPSYWLDGAVFVCVVGAAGVIVMQVMAMLAEPADGAAEPGLGG